MTDRLRLAAQALLDRLTAVHADPAYESVWVVSQMHVGPYAGPTYTEELDALRRALAEPAPCPECGHDAGHHSWSVDGWLCVEAGCPCKRKHTDG